MLHMSLHMTQKEQFLELFLLDQLSRHRLYLLKSINQLQT